MSSSTVGQGVGNRVELKVGSKGSPRGTAGNAFYFFFIGSAAGAVQMLLWNILRLSITFRGYQLSVWLFSNKGCPRTQSFSSLKKFPGSRWPGTENKVLN